MSDILQTLNNRYPDSKVTKLANTGDFAAAADEAGRFGMWGLWEQLRTAAGLPSDTDARAKWLKAFIAAKVAHYKKW